MKHLLTTIILALTCATLHAQSVVVKGTSAGNVRGTGAGSVRGVVAIETTYSSNRFSIWSDNTNVVTDNDSDIMWTRNANIGGKMDWTNAVSYCSNLTNAAYSDWRLPSMPELSRDGGVGATNGLADAQYSANDPALPLGHPFANVRSDGVYWTSTEVDAGKARSAGMSDGGVFETEKVTTWYVWPCRGP